MSTPEPRPRALAGVPTVHPKLYTYIFIFITSTGRSPPGEPKEQHTRICNFRRLVLGCIKTKITEGRLIATTSS